MPESSAHPRVFLQAGQDRRIAGGHPWAYSNEIRMDAATKALPPGSLVTLHRVDGRALGVGMFNPHTLIAFRLLDPDPQTIVDIDFLAGRLRRAARLRTLLFEQPYYRLVHAEADGLPGVIIDRFGDAVVIQCNTAGAERLLPDLVTALERVLSPTLIVHRADAAARALEGLVTRVDVLKGQVDGPIDVVEGTVTFAADVIAGQKTGWFYDQRRNRGFVASLAREGVVLDVFCHSGGFALSTLASGAKRALAIDSSETALALARRAAERNGFSERITFQKADGFEALARLAAADGERFRVVVADPPAFAPSRKDVPTGLKAYRKLARLAAGVVEPEGFLFIASCSHNVTAEAFALEVARGITAAGRQGRVIRAAGADADHPVHLHVPETAYLKSLTVQLN